MRVLIVGGGGREHALAWALGKSPELDALFMAPGNGGTEAIARNVAINPGDIDTLAGFALREKIGLTVVGPEAPLVGGIVDRFKQDGLLCFGPTRNAARLEGSKVFAKQFMHRHDIPTADFEIFEDADAARQYVSDGGTPIVVKADGLAQGKGVYVAKTVAEAEKAIDEIMIKGKFGESGERIVIETMLRGEELSVHAICDGERAVLLPSSQDHKRAYDGDEGPNTGGMGAYAPVPFVSDEVRLAVEQSVINPVLKGMKSEGAPYTGVLYVGLMLTEDGPKVLEFNVRFGDPETQVLVPLVKSDLLEILYEAAKGSLPERIELYNGLSTATVVMASGGYPSSYEKGFAISGTGAVENEELVLFHAGTKKTADGLVTSGGRVLAVTARKKTLAEALACAYDGVQAIHFQGAFWRKDIGKRAL
jgi:phosphoribosylamine--glycine ligase